jgi:hypothetical protein
VNLIGIGLVVLLCAAAYSRKYWFFLAALALCCFLTPWGRYLVAAIAVIAVAAVVAGLLIAFFLPKRVVTALRICNADGWRGEKAVALTEAREGGRGYPLRPGRWLRVRFGEKEFPALMFALDDSPVSIGDELEILHEISEQYDEITSGSPEENERENAEKAGAAMIEKYGLPRKIPAIISPPSKDELEKDNLRRRPALIFTYLEVAKKPAAYYDLPPQHGLK